MMPSRQPPSPPPPPAPVDSDTESWTVVTRKTTKARHNHRLRAVAAPDLPNRPRSPPPRSAAAIAAEYRRIRAAWDAADSPPCAALRARVAAAAAAGSEPVSRAVCLGIGSFDPPDGAADAKRRTFLQLIAFLVMVDELEKSLRRPVPCIFQDPVFSSADRDFIARLGHRVVDPPDACDAVTPHTLLFGVHLYRPVYVMALRNHLPAIFVGTGWDVWHQLSLQESHDLHRLRDMERSYAKVAFPQDPSSTAFSSTSIYWRTSPAADGPGAASQQGKPAPDATARPETEAYSLSALLPRPPLLLHRHST